MTKHRALILTFTALILCAAAGVALVEAYQPQRLRGEPALVPQTLRPPVVVALSPRVMR